MRLLYAIPVVLLPNALHLPDKVAAASSLGLLLVAFLLGTRDPPRLPRNGYLTPPLVGVFLAVLLGFVVAQWNDVSKAADGVYRLQIAILYPLLYLAYRHSGLDLAATRQLIMLVLAVAVIAGLEAIWQGLRFDLGAFNPAQRATGPFEGAANRAGVFFAMFLPMFVALVLQPNQRTLVRWLAVAGGAILVAAILFTFSRQSYLIALMGILLLLVRRSVPMAALATLLILIGVGLLPDGIVQRVLETRQVDGTGTAAYDPSTVSRLKIWQGALAMLADHPGGVGPGRFDDYIGIYTDFPGMDAHNGFVLMLAECGPLGLAMLVWLVWRLWKLAGRLRRVDGSSRPETHALALGFTLSMLSMTLGNLYGSPFMTTEVMANFWILCGLLERYGIAMAHEAATRDILGRQQMATSFGIRFPLAARAFPGLVATRPFTRR